MENFFIDDKFYSNLDELLEDLEIETIEEIPYIFSEKAESASLESVSDGIDYEGLEDFIIEHYCGDRMPEDSDISFENKIKKAIKESIDIEKLNRSMPKLWYANNEFFTINRNDLVVHLGLPFVVFEENNTFRYQKDFGYWQNVPSDVKFYAVKEINNMIEFVGNGYGLTKDYQKYGLFGKYGSGSIAVLISDIPHLVDFCRDNFLEKIKVNDQAVS